jgi:hypothetical protein
VYRGLKGGTKLKKWQQKYSVFLVVCVVRGSAEAEKRDSTGGRITEKNTEY